MEKGRGIKREEKSICVRSEVFIFFWGGGRDVRVVD